MVHTASAESLHEGLLADGSGREIRDKTQSIDSETHIIFVDMMCDDEFLNDVHVWHRRNSEETSITPFVDASNDDDDDLTGKINW